MTKMVRSNIRWTFEIFESDSRCFDQFYLSLTEISRVEGERSAQVGEEWELLGKLRLLPVNNLREATIHDARL
jgi:hypothetical protein